MNQQPLTLPEPTNPAGESCIPKTAAGLHAVLGFLLMSMDFLATALPNDIGPLVSLQLLYPLLPCVGLFWVLIATGLLDGSDETRIIATAVHKLLLAISLFGIGLAVVFYWHASAATDNESGWGSAICSAVLAVLSVPVLCTSSLLLIVLRKMKRSCRSVRLWQSRGAKVLVLAGVVVFFANVAFWIFREQVHAAQQAEIEHTVAHSGLISALDFSADESQLAAAGDDPTAIAITQAGDVLAMGAGRWLMLYDGNDGTFLREIIKP